MMMQDDKLSQKLILIWCKAQFWKNTSGAVTVDWVVLTAAIVAMVVTFMAGFTTATDNFLVGLLDSI